jgi:hypothetical protein
MPAGLGRKLVTDSKPNYPPLLMTSASTVSDFSLPLALLRLCRIVAPTSPARAGFQDLLLLPSASQFCLQVGFFVAEVDVLPE